MYIDDELIIYLLSASPSTRAYCAAAVRYLRQWRQCGQRNTIR